MADIVEVQVSAFGYPSLYWSGYIDSGGVVHHSRRWWSQGVEFQIPVMVFDRRAEKAREDFFCRLHLAYHGRV